MARDLLTIPGDLRLARLSGSKIVVVLTDSLGGVVSPSVYADVRFELLDGAVAVWSRSIGAGSISLGTRDGLPVLVIDAPSQAEWSLIPTGSLEAWVWCKDQNAVWHEGLKFRATVIDRNGGFS